MWRLSTYPHPATFRAAAVCDHEGMHPHIYRAEHILGQVHTRGAASINALCKAGTVVDVGHHWYAFAEELGRGLDARVVYAAENGLLIGCLTACEHWGLWTPPSLTTPDTHYIQSRGSNRNQPRTGSVHRQLAHGCFGNHLSPARSPQIISPPNDAIEHVLRYHDAETGLIVLESALYQRFIYPNHADAMIGIAQKVKRPILERYELETQSGSETRVRNFLQSRQVSVQPQVFIPQLGRVDLLVGTSLIIECDSQEFHSQPLNVAEDRRRDQVALRLGYTVVRLSYRDVWFQWEKTQEYISNLLKKRVHRRRIP
ncbi:Uncharacterised protein [Arcanobacterium haemolyticum]|nr:Uncharacterised protein [Arcanobacterium haemolyticum]